MIIPFQIQRLFCRMIMLKRILELQRDGGNNRKVENAAQ
jgi:hypothetical protein